MADLQPLLERHAKFFAPEGVARVKAHELHDELRVYDYAFACMLCGFCLAEARAAANRDAIKNWTEVWIRLVENFHKGIR